MPTLKKLIGTAVAIVMPLTTAIAQDPVGDIGDDLWVGVVATGPAVVRCGANESYYPIATAREGDFVRVLGKRQDWLSVELVGSVFKDTVGYIKYPEENTSLFAVAGTQGVATGEIEVLANNIDSDELYRSWRPVLRLGEGDTVEIVDSKVTKPGTLHRESYIVHTVVMPEGAVGWINTTHVMKATDEQLAGFAGWSGYSTSAEMATNTSGDTGTSNDLMTTVNDATIKEEMEFESTETETVSFQPLSLVELEAMWEEITSEPVMGAEVSPLKDMYLELRSDNQDDLVLSRISNVRIKQLEIWSGLQEQRVKIDALRTDLASKSEKVSEYQSAMSMYGSYAMVGRLSLSHTFNGRLRPFMYRILDQKSGRTLGYLPANEDWNLSGLIGQYIGVSGENTWNPTWRVNVVNATRFDILSPTTATITPDIQ